ncbi:MAG: rhomboid family intramembrane serine protease [Verrucomicrobiales bacterium]|nr:rhomboid family intramembrane serine protease [Verrucomicrobiales bacterium]
MLSGVQVNVTVAQEPWIIIRARSRRQAMDWSLVLASQGIEPVIQHVPDEGGWGLRVNAGHHEAALAAIQQYRRENRGWRWRHRVASSEFTFHWGALVWGWGLILFHWWSAAWAGGLENAGAMNHRVAETGEWWRLFTATTLHADLGHLSSNVATGFVVLGLAMGRYGVGWALLAATFAGAFGNWLGLVMRQTPYIGLGASGVVMGALGLLTVYSFSLFRGVPGAKRQIIAGAAGGVILFALLGLSPNSDVLAHAGGFAGGVAFGLVFAWLPPAWLSSARANLLAGLSCGLGLAACWGLAMFR